VYLAYEGCHGAGKSSTVARLATSGEVYGVQSAILPYSIVTALPGDPRTVYRVLDELKSLVALRAVEAGMIAVADRTYASTLAFAAYVAAVEGDHTFLKQSLVWADTSAALLRPDICILIDIDAETSWTRIGQRDGSHWIQRERLDFMVDFYRSPPKWFVRRLAIHTVLAVGSADEGYSVALDIINSRS
jgi:Thymidylate kinase